MKTFIANSKCVICKKRIGFGRLFVEQNWEYRHVWHTEFMAKRPRDPNQLAKLIVDIATGKVPDPVSEQKRKPSGLKGRSGGLKGGKARATALTQEQRKRIAAKAAQARWHSRKDE